MPPPLRAAARHRIAYRAETAEDAAFVADLYASTRAEELAASGWPEAMQRAFLDQQCHAQHAAYRQAYADAEWLIVEQDGASIGRLYLAELDGGIRLVDIALLPERRGQGLGRAILTDLIDEAKRRKVAVSLHVEPGNPAIALYRRLGFREVGSVQSSRIAMRRAP